MGTDSGRSVPCHTNFAYPILLSTVSLDNVYPIPQENSCRVVIGAAATRWASAWPH